MNLPPTRGRGRAVSRRRRSWRERGNYVWTTRKPFALWSIPLPFMLLLALLCSGAMLYSGARWWALLPLLLLKCTGRHIAYVGETGSRYRRDIEHIYGGGKFKAKPKPWSDLEPRVFAVPALPWWRWSRRLTEKLWIWLLLPVYNVQHNTRNPRRIKPWVAEKQRAVRDGARRKRRAWVG